MKARASEAAKLLMAEAKLCSVIVREDDSITPNDIAKFAKSSNLSEIEFRKCDF
jgi:hypothetical protein